MRTYLPSALYVVPVDEVPLYAFTCITSNRLPLEADVGRYDGNATPLVASVTPPVPALLDGGGTATPLAHASASPPAPALLADGGVATPLAHASAAPSFDAAGTPTAIAAVAAIHPPVVQVEQLAAPVYVKIRAKNVQWRKGCPFQLHQDGS